MNSPESKHWEGPFSFHRCVPSQVSAVDLSRVFTLNPCYNDSIVPKDVAIKMNVFLSSCVELFQENYMILTVNLPLKEHISYSV